MKRIGLVVIVAAVVIIGYFWSKPPQEREITPIRPVSDLRPLPAVTEPGAPASPESGPNDPDTPPSSATPEPTAPAGAPPVDEPDEEPPSLFTEFEAQPVDPQWSEENEIRLENYLFANENYSALDIEGIQCKASLCEIRVYEKANTVWARVVHNLARDQGWDQTSWRYADYYDSDGKRLIRTVVGQQPGQKTK